MLSEEVPTLYAQRRPENVREKNGDIVRTNFAAHLYSKPFARLLANRMDVAGMDMEHIAGVLAHRAGQPVVNKTGLTGNYDFKLSYAAANDANPSLPDFFTALQEQLGLKLESQKVPVDFLVIDHFDKRDGFTVLGGTQHLAQPTHRVQLPSLIERFEHTVGTDEERIARQDIIVERFRGTGWALFGDAVRLLAAMRDLRDTMRDHAAKVLNDHGC